MSWELYTQHNMPHTFTVSCVITLTTIRQQPEQAQAIFEPKLSLYKYPNILYLVILHTYPPMKTEQSVPKRWHITFRRRGITQKKA